MEKTRGKSPPSSDVRGAGGGWGGTVWEEKGKGGLGREESPARSSSIGLGA